jgi:hypothetical protein
VKLRELSVFTRWELSFQELKAEREGPRQHKVDLLNILAFSYGRQVSEKLFNVFCSNINAWDSQEAMKKSPGAFLAEQLGNWDSQSFGECLTEFHQLCLIQSYEYGGFYEVFLHFLVKEWIMLRTEKTRSLEYKLLATEILLESMHSSEPREATATLVSADFADDLDSREPEGEEIRTINKERDTYSYTADLLHAQSSLAEVMSDAGHYRGLKISVVD